MRTYSEDEMKVMLDYYSFDNNGTKTIAIHYTHGLFADPEWNYSVLGNGGVALWVMHDEEFATAARLCVQLGITINPVIEH